MGGVGFEPPSSESDLRKSKKNVRRGNRTHDMQAVKESKENERKKSEAWESNPRPRGSEGKSNEMKEKRCEAWESNPRPPRQIHGEN